MHIPTKTELTEQAANVASGKATTPEIPEKYASVSMAKLKKMVVTDPDAADAMWNRFRQMPDARLRDYAKRGYAMAQVIYDARVPANTPLETLMRGEGRFSAPGRYTELVDDILADRAQSNIARRGRGVLDPDVAVEGGTVSAARTDIPGLENARFNGRSPAAGGQVNPRSPFSPSTDYDLLPHTHGHAEQNLADQLHASLALIDKQKLKGRRVWMLIEQEPCSTCASGLTDPTVAPGVLRKLSEAYPDVIFEVKNLNTSGLMVLKNGRITNR